MEIQEIEVTIKGIHPLLQNAFGAADDTKVATRTKVEYNDVEEAESRLIKNSDGLICQPARQIEATMVKAAADFKMQGRKTYKEPFKAGVFVIPLMIPHKNYEWTIDKQPVVIQRARIMRCRPMFENWELSFTIQIRDERISPPIVREVLETAGKFNGIGDYRPRYGLFDVTKFEVKEQSKAAAA